MSTALYSTFRPVAGTNQTVTATVTSSNINITSYFKVLRIVNSGTRTAYVRIGAGPQTATPADMPVLPGEHIIVHKAYGENNVGYLAESNPGTTLHLQLGDGE